MTKGQITVLLFLCLLTAVYRATAQQTGTDDTIPGLKDFEHRLQLAYNNASYLGFHVKYRYANEAKPDVYLDSVSGEVQMDRGRSRAVIDGMETVFTGHYTIQVMQENKSIYLAAAQAAAGQNPLPMLDSVFRHINGTRVAVKEKDGLDVLALDFPADKPYSRMELAIDHRTGYLQWVEYSLNTAGLVGEEMVESPGHPAPYQSKGRIQILFTGYEHGRFDERVFREDNFFTRVAGQYEPAGRYKDYHIYLASSNL